MFLYFYDYIYLNRFFWPRAIWFIVYVMYVKSLELQNDYVTSLISFVKLHFKSLQPAVFLCKSLQKTRKGHYFLFC